MLLRAQGEGVHVDTAAGHVLVVLVGLDQVEVLAIANGESVVAIELQQSLADGVLAVLEGHGHVHVVGTTSGHTGHGAGSGVGVVGGDDTAHVGLTISGGRGTSTGGVGVVISIGVVEPLLAPRSRVTNVVIGLADPNQLLCGMIEVELELVVGVGGGLVTGELELLDQIFVGDLSERLISKISQRGGLYLKHEWLKFSFIIAKFNSAHTDTRSVSDAQPCVYGCKQADCPLLYPIIFTIPKLFSWPVHPFG